MSKPRAFISFQMEDRWARDFLVQHARTESNNVDFIDYSVQDPFDSAWKTECAKRIALTKGTIVLIGPDTTNSTAVDWEIAETFRQRHPIFGIQTRRDRTYGVPIGLFGRPVVRWNFSDIASQLRTWG